MFRPRFCTQLQHIRRNLVFKVIRISIWVGPVSDHTYMDVAAIARLRMSHDWSLFLLTGNLLLEPKPQEPTKHQYVALSETHFLA